VAVVEAVEAAAGTGVGSGRASSPRSDTILNAAFR
jgi:hypothetical protein